MQKKCPICKKKFIQQGLANHIINAGKAEVWKQFNFLLDCNKRSKIEFSRIVILRNLPHLSYWRKNQKTIKKFLLNE